MFEFKLLKTINISDIPPQIVLGKTIHGKKLVASVRTEKTNNLIKNSKQTNSFKSGSGQCEYNVISLLIYLFVKILTSTIFQ